MDIDLKEIDAASADSLLNSGQALVVDVRETAEFEFEHIPGSFLLPLSFLDTDLFPRIEEKSVVLVCAVGKRSAAAGKQLLKAGFRNVSSLKGGLDAWKEAGLETEGARFEVTDFSI